MNTLTCKAVAIAAILVSSNFAFANTYLSASDERKLVNVCEATKDNNVAKLKRMVKKTRLSYKDLQRDILCNGISPMDFAIDNNAEDTALYIAKRAKIDKNIVLAKLNKSETSETVSGS